MKQFHPHKCIKILNEKVRELIGKLEENPDEKEYFGRCWWVGRQRRREEWRCFRWSS
jgi:hypothetical protein